MASLSVTNERSIYFSQMQQALTLRDDLRGLFSSRQKSIPLDSAQSQVYTQLKDRITYSSEKTNFVLVADLRGIKALMTPFGTLPLHLKGRSSFSFRSDQDFKHLSGNRYSLREIDDLEYEAPQSLFQTSC